MWKDLPHKNYIYLSLGLSAASALSVFIFKNFLPPVVPLLYGRPVGQSQLVGYLGLLIAPTVAFAITLVNLFIAKRIQDNFLKRVLIVSSFFISLLAAITFFRIIFLVGFFN